MADPMIEPADQVKVVDHSGKPRGWVLVRREWLTDEMELYNEPAAAAPEQEPSERFLDGFDINDIVRLPGPREKLRARGWDTPEAILEAGAEALGRVKGVGERSAERLIEYAESYRVPTAEE